MQNGRTVKAVFSGVANAVMTEADLDTPVSYEGLAAVGSGMGSAGFIVYDDTACMVDAAYRFSRILSIESCGQCSPCKLGSAAITHCLERIENGAGTDNDLEVMGGWLPRVTDASRCYLATEERIVVSSILRAFPEEFADHVEQQRCRSTRRDPMPKLVDLADGHAVYDETFWRKRPDWTYEPDEGDGTTPSG
jgi:NADH-quinone oxidoreductase subunit F